MSDKLLWSSVVIKVPSNFISVNDKGKIFIKPPLNKKSNTISKAKGKPSIIIETDDNINKVVIANEGEYKTADNKMIKKKVDKELVKKSLKKNKALLDIEKEGEDIERTSMQNKEDVNVVSKKRMTKGSEEAKEFMKMLREKKHSATSK